jgi:hypothetical protein
MKYEIKIRFNTDRTLTEKELDQLLFAISVQIEEPTDATGDDESFTTNDIRIESKGDLTNE